MKHSFYRAMSANFKAVGLFVTLTIASAATGEEHAKDSTGTSDASTEQQDQLLIEMQTRRNGLYGYHIIGDAGNPDISFGYYWTKARWYPPYTNDFNEFSKLNSGYLKTQTELLPWENYNVLDGANAYQSDNLFEFGTAFSGFLEYPGSSSNTTEYDGRIEEHRFRISATSKDHQPYQEILVKVTRKGTYSTIGSSHPLAIVSVDPFVVALPTGNPKSEWYELKAPLTDGLDTSVSIFPVKVSWKAIGGYENVDDHTDPWTHKINGKRIFPDAKDPDHLDIQNKLEVIVKTSPALVGQTVYVKAFDVDDSTDEEFDKDYNGVAGPVGAFINDPNDKGGDNLPDYLETPQNGRFWNGTDSTWGGDTSIGTVDTNGETKFTFEVGMQPGNNYRIVASIINESLYNGVQTDPANPKYLGPDLSQNGGAPATPLLTVWRKLWVENDSMREFEYDSFHNKRNDMHRDIANPVIKNTYSDSTSTQTVVEIDPVYDYSSFHDFENGYIKIGGISYLVLGTSVVLEEDMETYTTTVKIDGVGHPITTGMGYRLYDDDEFGVGTGLLPRSDLAGNVQKSIQYPYEKAFIDIVDASSWNADKLIDAYRNLPPLSGTLSTSLGAWDDALDNKLLGTKNLWCATVVAGYQGEDLMDNDPHSEPESEGVTPVRMLATGDPLTVHEGRVSIVYVETIRDGMDDTFRSPRPGEDPNDLFRFKLGLTAAHEIGHHPHFKDGSEHHDEGGLMQDGGYLGDKVNKDDPSANFSPVSVKRFRQVFEWRVK